MSKILKVGLDFSAPIPLHTDYTKDKFEGFEVDLMKQIAKRLNVGLQYEVLLWKDILSFLDEGKIDLICSAATITAERLTKFDFSRSYLDFQLCAVIKKNHDLGSVNELKGKNIGVRKASEAEKYIHSHVLDYHLTSKDDNETLYNLLNSGEVDVLIDDSPIAGAFTKMQEDLKIGLFLPGSNSSYAMVLKKGNNHLKDKLDKAIEQLICAGDYQHLKEKWFDKQF